MHYAQPKKYFRKSKNFERGSSSKENRENGRKGKIREKLKNVHKTGKNFKTFQRGERRILLSGQYMYICTSEFRLATWAQDEVLAAPLPLLLALKEWNAS